MSSGSNDGALEREVIAILEGLGPLAVRVREGGGPENIAASLAVSVAKLKRMAEEPVVEPTDGMYVRVLSDFRRRMKVDSKLLDNALRHVIRVMQGKRKAPDTAMQKWAADRVEQRKKDDAARIERNRRDGTSARACDEIIGYLDKPGRARS